MLIIPVKNPKDIDRALKNLKNKVSRIGLVRELRERQAYKKPSVKKREMKAKAIYIEKKNREENE